jgi:NADPH:quinone reductase-like Zn-dependent oxidoreductase
MARAVAAVEFGGPDRLEVVNRRVRTPELGEVRLQVAAAAVNPADLVLVSGRAASAFETLTPPFVVGMDAAGIVEAVGPGVDRLGVGEAVMAPVAPIRPDGGAQSELVVVPEASVVPIPDGATFGHAATLPMNGLTAIDAIAVMGLPEGATLLITGGAGWLSRLTIPLAAEKELFIVADAALPEQASLLDAGADMVLDRGDDLAKRVREAIPDGVDGVLDTALLGDAVLPALRDEGTYAVLRAGCAVRAERGIQTRAVSGLRQFENTSALLELRKLASVGSLPMLVHAEYPIERAADARASHGWHPWPDRPALLTRTPRRRPRHPVMRRVRLATTSKRNLSRKPIVAGYLRVSERRSASGRRRVVRANSTC